MLFNSIFIYSARKFRFNKFTSLKGQYVVDMGLLRMEFIENAENSFSEFQNNHPYRNSLNIERKTRKWFAFILVLKSSFKS